MESSKQKKNSYPFLPYRLSREATACNCDNTYIVAVSRSRSMLQTPLWFVYFPGRGLLPHQKSASQHLEPISLHTCTLHRRLARQITARGIYPYSSSCNKELFTRRTSFKTDNFTWQTLSSHTIQISKIHHRIFQLCAPFSHCQFRPYNTASAMTVCVPPRIHSPQRVVKYSLIYQNRHSRFKTIPDWRRTVGIQHVVRF